MVTPTLTTVTPTLTTEYNYAGSPLTRRYGYACKKSNYNCSRMCHHANKRFHGDYTAYRYFNYVWTWPCIYKCKCVYSVCCVLMCACAFLTDELVVTDGLHTDAQVKLACRKWVTYDNQDTSLNLYSSFSHQESSLWKICKCQTFCIYFETYPQEALSVRSIRIVHRARTDTVHEWQND